MAKAKKKSSEKKSSEKKSSEKGKKKSSEKGKKKPNGWRQHHVGQQHATSSSGSGMSAHGMSVRDVMYGPTREHMQKPKAHKKSPCAQVNVLASDIMGGYRRSKSPLKRWTCAGVIRTGCGGSGSRVTNKVR